MTDPNVASNLRAGVTARSKAKYGKTPSKANVDATMKRTAKRARIAARAAAKVAGLPGTQPILPTPMPLQSGMNSAPGGGLLMPTPGAAVTGQGFVKQKPKAVKRVLPKPPKKKVGG